MPENESIGRILDEEAAELAPKRRAALVKRFGEYLTRSCIQSDLHGRTDEVSRLEDWIRQQAPMPRPERDAIAEYLFVRRAELTANRNDDETTLDIERNAILAELDHMVEFLKDSTGDIATRGVAFGRLATLMMDFIEYRKRDLNGEKHPHECSSCGGHFYTHLPNCEVPQRDSASYNHQNQCMTCGAEQGKPHDPHCPFSDKE